MKQSLSFGDIERFANNNETPAHVSVLAAMFCDGELTSHEMSELTPLPKEDIEYLIGLPMMTADDDCFPYHPAIISDCVDDEYRKMAFLILLKRACISVSQAIFSICDED